MATLKWDCPQCAARSSMFTTANVTYHPPYKLHYATGFCGVCTRPSLFEIACVPNSQNYGSILQGQQDLIEPSLPERIGRPTGLTKISVIRTFPEAPKADAPDHLNDGIKRRFIDAGEAYGAGRYEQAGFSARKALEVAVGILDATAKGSLKARIDALSSKGIVAPPLVELAHAVRLEGNSAVHDDDVWTQQDAHRLIEFARLFLVYVFTLPAEIKALREEP
jgi:hypothetical protein